MWLATRAVASYESPGVIMKNLVTAIPPIDDILQCSRGLMALTRFLIISAVMLFTRRTCTKADMENGNINVEVIFYGESSILGRGDYPLNTLQETP